MDFVCAIDLQRVCVCGCVCVCKCLWNGEKNRIMYNVSFIFDAPIKCMDIENYANWCIYFRHSADVKNRIKLKLKGGKKLEHGTEHDKLLFSRAINVTDYCMRASVCECVDFQ